jgi:hypothetical protein
MHTQVNNAGSLNSFYLLISNQRRIYREQVLQYEICDSLSSTTFVPNTFHTYKYLYQVTFEMGAETHIDVNVNKRYCRPTLTNI